MAEEMKQCCACRHKETERTDDLQHDLTKRLNRAIGQLNGVKDMIADNRYCGDVLVQLAAAESAVHRIAEIVLQDHMETCVVEQVRAAVHDLYGDAGLVTGMAASLYDMKGVVTEDNQVTNLIAIAAILLVLVLTFKSATLPVILIATIESAIFLNLAVPYFTGDSLNYLGFLVINTVQLGATVDYAILFTDTYRKHRRSMPPRQALARTLGTSFQSILVSASILTSAGLVLWLTSTNNIVSLLGLLLARGTLLSFFLVVTFLPAALLIFDKLIAKTTWHAGFFRGGGQLETEKEADA